MPVEFALRPRIRLRDVPTPRRARFRLPRFTFHVLGYWLAIGGATYAFIHSADAARERVRSAAAPEPPEASGESAAREWWKPLSPARPLAQPEPERDFEPAALPEPTPSPTAAPEPVSVPAVAALEPPPERERAPEPLPAPQRAPDLPRERAPVVAAREPTVTPEPAPPVVPRERAVSGIPSCEAAIANASQDMDFGRVDRTADLPSSALAAVLENGVWFESCNTPESTKLEICVAIRAGRVIGASVATRPANPALATCVRNRAAGLHFPFSSRLDVARTRF